MKKLVLVFGALVILFSGCSIKREVKPVGKEIDKEVCIIEDTSVRQGFLQTYEQTLEQMGYKVKIIAQGSDKSACKTTSTYMGKWSWDLAIYLSYARINVYQDGELIGTALYDSRGGDARIFDKFGEGEEMIKSLVEELYKK